MIVLRYTFFLLLFVSSGYTQTKGYLFMIGGGERPPNLLQKFIDLSGGSDAKIYIIPCASVEPVETAELYIQEFKDLGCKNVTYINPDNHNVDSDTTLKILKKADGIFFTGGDQNRLTSVLLNTKFLIRLKEIYNNGGVIGGTSAGAAVLSRIMITGDELINTDTISTFSVIKKHNIKTAEGLSFIDNVIIDQHFIARKRHNRLISVVLENANLLGIGIDESTACIFTPENTMEVIGNNLVVIYDASESEFIEEDSFGNLSADNIKMSLLKSGDIYNLSNQGVTTAK